MSKIKEGDLSSSEYLIYVLTTDPQRNYQKQTRRFRPLLDNQSVRDFVWRIQDGYAQNESYPTGHKWKYELAFSAPVRVIRNFGGNTLSLLERLWRVCGSPSNVLPMGYMNSLNPDARTTGYEFMVDSQGMFRNKEFTNNVSNQIFLFFASDSLSALKKVRDCIKKKDFEILWLTKSPSSTYYTFPKRGGKQTIVSKYYPLYKKSKKGGSMPVKKKKSTTSGTAFVNAGKQLKKLKPKVKLSSKAYNTLAKRKAAIQKVKNRAVKQFKKDLFLVDGKTPLQILVNVAVGDSKNFKFKIGKRKVPEKMKQTARSKATKLYVFPGRKSYPIGDLYHARAATLRVMWTSNKKNRGKVLRAVITAYPQYNWKAYWEKERKEAKNSKTIKSFAQTIKQK